MPHKTFVILLFILSLTVAFITACGESDSVSLPDPVVHYTFDTNASPVPDEAGSGKGAVPMAAPAYLATGGIGGTGAYQIETNSQGFEIADEAEDLMESKLYGQDGYSISALINPKGTTTDGVYRIVYRYQGYDLKLEAGAFQFWTSSADLTSDHDYRNKTSVSVATLNPAGANDTWWHLVGVSDGMNVYLYVNGELAAQVVAESIVRDLDDGQATSIGDHDSSFGFLGIVDDVAIYDAPLDADQVKKLYEQVTEPAE